MPSVRLSFCNKYVLLSSKLTSRLLQHFGSLQNKKKLYSHMKNFEGIWTCLLEQVNNPMRGEGTSTQIVCKNKWMLGGMDKVWCCKAVTQRWAGQKLIQRWAGCYVVAGKGLGPGCVVTNQGTDHWLLLKSYVKAMPCETWGSKTQPGDTFSFTLVS